RIRQAPLTTATPLRTVRGTLAELSTVDTGNAWLRVYLRERPRAGLREEVQQLLPRALEVRIDPQLLAEQATEGPHPHRTGRAPSELFAAYLEDRGHADPAVSDLFNRLHAELLADGAEPAGQAPAQVGA
ncbi:MAG: exonuclease SbcCD subunit D C-terminal domain-containing protein, partial [Micromonosporaceae bacterium]|nr:exonuclease SbcCD subunit D C-terminal domain-containing protein [Micromonosporaceae bacterium]